MPYLYLFAGLAVLIICGNYLVTGSVQLARHFKVSTLIVGLTIVAYGTSAPEMFIGVGSALRGAHDIALGNVIGSNIANIGCILAMVAIICPLSFRNKAIGFDLIVMFLLSALLFIFGSDGKISRLEGIIFVSLLLSYTVYSVIKAKKSANSQKTEAPTIKPLVSVIMISASIVGLYFGSDWFVGGAREIALKWGVSERVIAISVVAIGTSMPEFVASLIAAFRKEADLSIGNIIGSNLFNISGVLGVTAIVNPLNINSPQLFTYDMLWLFGISAALVLTMIPLSKGIIRRREGVFLLLIFAVYMFMLFR